MEFDELDRLLSEEEDIVPSSGFVASVMDAVRQQAAAPPPIPFPWKRALPGLAACALALLWLLVVGIMGFSRGAALAPAAPPPVIVRILEAASAAGVGWIALALLVSLVSVTLSMRLTGGRT